MAADWGRVLDRLSGTPLAGDLHDLILKAGEQDPSQVDTWKLLVSIATGPEYRRRALTELCRLEPEQETWRTQLATLPATAPAVIPPVRRKLHVAWGTRLAVWSAVLSLLCVFAIAYFNSANQESLLLNERPLDLLWFARCSEPEVSPEAQRITQRLAELDQQAKQIQESMNSLTLTVRSFGASRENLHKDVTDLKNLQRNAELRVERFESEYRASTDRLAKLIQSLDARVQNWQKARSRVVNPFWDWFWRDRSLQEPSPSGEISQVSSGTWQGEKAWCLGRGA